jgi:hypothetical protein
MNQTADTTKYAKRITTEVERVGSLLGHSVNIMADSVPPPIKRVLRFFGSVQLAMLLLAVVIAASIIGTFIESRFDASVAEGYVYGAPWFILWLLLLCVNLIGAVVVRFPWKKHQLGFVLTHAGIVMILVGGIIGRIWGIEGNMTLVKEGRPSHFITMNQLMLHARTPAMPDGIYREINLAPRPPSKERPLTINLEGARVSMLEFAERLAFNTVVEPAHEGSPALRIALHNETNLEAPGKWLVLNDPARAQSQVGGVMIRFLEDRATVSNESRDPPAPPPSSTAKACCPPGDSDHHLHGSAEDSASLSRERIYVFAKMPDMTIVQALEGNGSGVQAGYQFPGLEEFSHGDRGVLFLEVNGEQFEVPAASLLDQALPLENSPWMIEHGRFFADFRMEGKQPASGSDEPNNPALLFELTGPARSGAPHANPARSLPAGHPIIDSGSRQKLAARRPAELTIFYDESGGMRFEGASPSWGNADGPVAPGEWFGWQQQRFRIEEWVERASARDELTSHSEGINEPIEASGALIQVERNGARVSKWIRLGQGTTIHAGDAEVQITFGYRLAPLNFGVVLEDFVVDRNEGMMTPAGFSSQVRFVDFQSKKEFSRPISMNKPANFPDFPGIGLTGLAYKFSQASWNPNDLEQTTLMVLRDPGWPLKWIGSLIFCGGLLTMFYLRPYPRFVRNSP